MSTRRPLDAPRGDGAAHAPAAPTHGVRHLLRTCGAYARLHAVDDVSYPLALGLKIVALVVPLFAFYFVGMLVDTPPDDTSLGSDYFTFVALGIAVVAVIGTAVVGFGQRLQQLQQQGSIETLLIEPAPWTVLPVAMNVWPAALGTATCGLVLGLAGVMGAQLSLAGLPAFLGVLALGMAASASVGILSASLLILAKRSDPVVQLYRVVAPLLGGAMFPLELLPGWLLPVSYLLPHTYLIAGARHTLMATPPTSGPDLATSLLGLAVFATVGVGLALWLFHRSLRYARRVGLLGSY